VQSHDEGELEPQTHWRSAPPAWLVPISAEQHRHVVTQHALSCGLNVVPDFAEYQCPCPAPTLTFALCPMCGDPVFVVAHDVCEHLITFVRHGVPIRWWAS
jgi:hypothetical protein